MNIGVTETIRAWSRVAKMTHFSPLSANGRGGALGLRAVKSQVPNRSCRLAGSDTVHAPSKPHPLPDEHVGHIRFSSCHSLSSGEIFEGQRRSVWVLEIQQKQELRIIKYFLHATYLA